MFVVFINFLGFLCCYICSEDQFFVPGWEDHLQNNLYCVQWVIKPYYNYILEQVGLDLSRSHSAETM